MKTKEIYLSSGQLPAPAPVCPACRRLLDGFTGISDRRPGARPKPGDVTICDCCLVFYKFHGAPLQVRAMSQDELAKLHEDIRALHRVMVINRALHPQGDDWPRRPN